MAKDNIDSLDALINLIQARLEEKEHPEGGNDVSVKSAELDDPNLERARRWRLKAEEYRTVADQMMNPVAQANLRRLAASYDSLAERYERHAGRVEMLKKPEAG